MIRITIGNEKGGVGKTAMSTTLAAKLADKGYRVLLIDTDAQANATTSLGFRPGFELYNLLVQDAGWKGSLKVVSRDAWNTENVMREDGQLMGGLYLVPSDIQARTIPLSIRDPLILAERLEQVSHLFDVVVIDTPPTPSLLHVVIMNATDYFIVMTQAEASSFNGMQSTIGHINNLRKTGGTLEIAGIQVNHFRGNTLEHRENYDELVAWSDYPVWEPIPERIVWAEASRANMAVYKYAPADKAAGEALAFVNRVEDLITGVVRD